MMLLEKFLNREQGGKMLAEQLKAYAGKLDVLILALPRGGVPVAYEIAKALAIPLDVFIVRKLGVPGYAEFALGAIATGGIVVFNEEIVNALNIPKSAIEKVILSEQRELQRRETAYRGNKPFPELEGKTVILVDDGLATGATMRVAIKAVQQKQPAHIIVAAPVAASETCKEIMLLADELICLLRPSPLYSVGVWYSDFSQTNDTEVHKLLEDANRKNKYKVD